MVSLGAVCALTSAPAPAAAQTDSIASKRLRHLILLSTPEVAARRSAVEAAHARARAAGAASPATVTFDVDEVPGGNVAAAQSAGASLTWDLLTGGRRSLRRLVADRETDEATVQLGLAERRIVARTDQLLTRLVGSLAIGRRLAAEDSLLAAAEQALQTRFAVGDAPYVDVLRLRTERLRVQSDAAGAASDVSAHRRALLALVPAGQASGLEPLLDSAVAVEL